MNFRRVFILVSLVVMALSVGWAGAQDDGEVERLVPEVIAEYPHDPNAFTQGLFWHDGFLYEGTGRNGQSTLRRVELETGAVQQSVPLADVFFGEGIALVEDEIFQIVWRNGYAFVYDLETFETRAIFFYRTEGWGLCYDGQDLYMTDGSSTLYTREPNRFQITNEVTVTLDGEPVDQLNEIECVGDSIYANVWQTREAVIIDKATGEITAVIDATPLMPEEEWVAIEQDPAATLNGIAYNPEDDVFYMTGKLWDTLYEVRFVPAE